MSGKYVNLIFPERCVTPYLQCNHFREFFHYKPQRVRNERDQLTFRNRCDKYPKTVTFTQFSCNDESSLQKALFLGAHTVCELMYNIIMTSE